MSCTSGIRTASFGAVTTTGTAAVPARFGTVVVLPRSGIGGSGAPTAAADRFHKSPVDADLLVGEHSAVHFVDGVLRWLPFRVLDQRVPLVQGFTATALLSPVVSHFDQLDFTPLAEPFFDILVGHFGVEARHEYHPTFDRTYRSGVTTTSRTSTLTSSSSSTALTSSSSARLILLRHDIFETTRSK